MEQITAGLEAGTATKGFRCARHRPDQTLLYQLVERYYPELAELMAEQDRSAQPATHVARNNATQGATRHAWYRILITPSKHGKGQNLRGYRKFGNSGAISDSALHKYLNDKTTAAETMKWRESALITTGE